MNLKRKVYAQLKVMDESHYSVLSEPRELGNVLAEIIQWFQTSTIPTADARRITIEFSSNRIIESAEAPRNISLDDLLETQRNVDLAEVSPAIHGLTTAELIEARNDSQFARIEKIIRNPSAEPLADLNAALAAWLFSEPPANHVNYIESLRREFLLG